MREKSDQIKDYFGKPIVVFTMHHMQNRFVYSPDCSENIFNSKRHIHLIMSLNFWKPNEEI